MDIIFRVLGLIALCTERLMRFRINFIPLSVIIICGIIYLIGMLATAAYEGVMNDHVPRSMTLSAVLAHTDDTHNYIEVTGELHPDETVVFSSHADSEESDSFVPFTLPGQQQAILVQINKHADGVAKLESGGYHVVGMLRSISSDYHEPLRKWDYKIGAYPIDHEYQIVAGARPSSPVLMGAGALLLLGVLAAIIASIVLHYVIFREEFVSITGAAGPFAAWPRVSGQFGLYEQQQNKRFLNVPAFPLEGEDGLLHFLSNIDASNTFYGITVKKMQGLWALTFQASGLQLTAGRLYLGVKCYPALRLRYYTFNGKTDSTVVSFTSEADRARLVGWLEMPSEQRRQLLEHANT